jgi:hypothetical protein
MVVSPDQISKMEASDRVQDLKESLVLFYSTLASVLPKLEAVEAEADQICDKLQDHLEQALVCQRFIFLDFLRIVFVIFTLIFIPQFL